MGVNLDTLSRVELFTGLGRKELNRIADAMAERTFEAGEVVTTEGEPGVGFYVIEDGEARVTMHGEEVGRLRAGEAFGEIALIAETPRAATITAETVLRCYSMTSWDFRRVVERNGELAWALLASTARKLYENAERERALAAMPPRE